MKFNPNDFSLNEIIHVNKDYFEGKFFKLHVKNKDYVIFISRVGVALIDFEVYNIKHQIDIKYPIEHELICFNEQWDIPVNFFNPESYYHDLYLGDFLDNYEFELDILKDETIDYLHFFYVNENLIHLISNSILYKSLKKPTNSFEEKFSKFIVEICLNRINDNEYLLKKLMNIKDYKEKEENELKKYREDRDKKYQLLSKKYGSISYSSIERRTFDADKFLR